VAEPQPELSVVVPSVNGWSDLEGCLTALAAQDGARVEVLVADRIGPALRKPLQQRFPEARLLEADRGTTIPALRRQAFGAARAAVVGVIEDHVIVPRDWAQRMLAEHARGAEVVGGAIDNAATGSLVDWSAFLCEYSHCLQPPRGASTWLPGNNITYRRALLERFASVIAADQWEHVLHDALRAAGVTLESHPEIVAGHKKHYTIGEYVTQRYLYSRSWAGAQFGGLPLARRLVRGAASAVLPPLLLWRVVSRVWRSGRYRGALVGSLPLLCVYVVSWAAGEVAGCWFGPGDALSRVT